MAAPVRKILYQPMYIASLTLCIYLNLSEILCGLEQPLRHSVCNKPVVQSTKSLPVSSSICLRPFELYFPISLCTLSGLVHGILAAMHYA